jgi:hypothetical protein
MVMAMTSQQRLGRRLDAGQELRFHEETGEDAIMDHGKALVR